MALVSPLKPPLIDPLGGPTKSGGLPWEASPPAPPYDVLIRNRITVDGHNRITVDNHLRITVE